MSAISRISRFFLTTAAGRFLLGFVLVYAVVWSGIEAAFGPPSMSSGYLDSYKDEHERYLEIVKSDDYKLYAEKKMWGTAPTSIEDDALADKIVFVSEYETRDAFIAEQARRSRYETLFDFFKIAMAVALIVRFGRKPITGLLDTTIAGIRTRIEDAEAAAEAAARRKSEAEGKLAGLGSEHERILGDAQDRVALEQHRIQALTQHSLDQLAAETEDRKRQEQLKAQHALKTALVNASIARLTAQYEAERTPEQESALIARFVTQLEDLK